MNRSTYKAYLGWSVLRSPWPERREYLMVEDTVDDPRPITQGPRFDYDRDVTEQAGSPSEERCHNVATTGVDSGGLPGREGTTERLEREGQQRLVARSPLPSFT